MGMFQNPEVAFGGSAPMLELIEQIYAAVQTPALWRGVLDGISEAAQASQTFLFTDTGDPAMPRALSAGKSDPAALSLFVEHYAAVNVLAEPCDAMFPDGEVRYSHWAVEDTEFERSEFYADFFRPFDWHYSYGIKIPVPGQTPAYLSCQRPKHHRAFDEGDGVVLETLRPHLQRAFQLHQQMAGMRAETLGLEAALDAAEQAVIGLDAQGRMVLCNPRAMAMLEKGVGIRLVQGRLCCPVMVDQHALQGLLTATLLGGAGGAMKLRGTLQVTVSPYRGAVQGRSVPLAALVFLSDSGGVVGSRSATLRALYGLTPAEARIADLLLGGLEVREVAETLRITLETARSHVKRVLAKTGARRQSDLVRMMLRLPVV